MVINGNINFTKCLLEKMTAEIIKPFNKISKTIGNDPISFDKDEVYESFQKNSNDVLSYWFRFQQAWCNNAYSTFKDHDVYLILIYLFNKIWKSYSDRFEYFSIDQFYDKREIKIEKINLIEISHELKIPKETIRRKINFLQSKGVIKRKGKSIYIQQSLIGSKRLDFVIDILSTFLEKSSILLSKEKWFGKAFDKEIIKKFQKDFFTICWEHFTRLQISYLVRHRECFGDLETWNVWGSIGLSQYSDYSRQLKESLIEGADNYQNTYLQLFNHKPKNGINASSISEISGIPRATVIRKLKNLIKRKFIKKNEKLEYILWGSSKNFKIFSGNYMISQREKSDYLTIIFDLMKNSKFKV